MSADNWIAIFKFEERWYFSNMSASADYQDPPSFRELVDVMTYEGYFDKAEHGWVRTAPPSFLTSDEVMQHIDKLLDGGYFVVEYGIYVLRDPYPCTPENLTIWEEAIQKQGLWK